MNCQVLTLIATQAIDLSKYYNFRKAYTHSGGLNHKVQLVFPDHCPNSVMVKIIMQN